MSLNEFIHDRIKVTLIIQSFTNIFASIKFAHVLGLKIQDTTDTLTRNGCLKIVEHLTLIKLLKRF